MAEQFQSYSEFWPFYLREHGQPATRALHYCGSIASVIVLIWAIVTQSWWWLLAVPVLGYAPAWRGHFVVEGNKPASFKHPLWSLRGDLKMLGMALRGKMADEVTRLYGSASPTEDAPLLHPR